MKHLLAVDKILTIFDTLPESDAFDYCIRYGDETEVIFNRELTRHYETEDNN